MPPDNVLSRIPGYGGYSARRQQIQQEDAGELQQAGTLMKLQQMMQERGRAAAGEQRNEALRSAIAALPPEQRTREHVLPLLLQHGALKDALPMMNQEAKAQPIGSGGLRLPTGEVVPPAARPGQAPTSGLARLLAERDALPQGDPRRAIYDAGIKKETERQPQQPQIFPTVQTADGIFERRPSGLVRLLAPDTDKPIVPQPTAAAGLTPESAGKVAMAQQAVEGIATARGIVFDKDGNLNRALVGAINLPVVSGLPGNSQARIARSAMRNAIEAKLRIETGAAATEPEVERTLARFMPTVADTKESAKFKLDELEKFFKSSLSLTKGIKPTATAPATVDSLLEKYK